MTTNQTRIYDSQTGELVKVGDKRLSFRGEPMTVLNWIDPRHAGSTGRVVVNDGGIARVYYPSVIGCELR